MVLASGQSKRFGEGDKLAKMLRDKSVLGTVLEVVESVGFGQIYCVSPRPIQQGLTWIENLKPEAGQGHSLRLGVRAAQQDGWKTIAVALGDMPLVTDVNFVKLLRKTSRKQSAISISQGKRLPPACFNEIAVREILTTKSYDGARAVFDRLDLATVPMDAQTLHDVDTPEDLARVRNIMKQRES